MNDSNPHPADAPAHEAYLNGRRRGFAESWVNAATIIIALGLLIVAPVLATA